MGQKRRQALGVRDYSGLLPVAPSGTWSSATRCGLLGFAALVVLVLFFAAPALAAGTEILQVTTSGTGAGYVEGPEIFCGNGAESCQAQFESNELVTLIATPTERSTFAGWTGCERDPNPNECDVRILTEAQTDVVAQFSVRPQEALTVRDPGSGPGGGFVHAERPGSEFSEIECGDERESCVQEYNQGTAITLEETPNERSTFTGWSGCSSEPSPTQCRVLLNAPAEVIAHFTPISQKALTVSVVGAGTVSSAFIGPEFPSIECGNGAEACEGQFNRGSTVTLTATRSTHNSFLGWTGCEAESGPENDECVVTMSGSKAVSAEFAPIPQNVLTVTVSGGTGEVSTSPAGISCSATGGTCSEYFDAEGGESTVTIFATPAPDYGFLAWGPGACQGSTTPECVVEMTAPRTVKAEFQPILHKLAIARVGAGSILSSPSGIDCGEDLCEAEFQEGSSVILTAHPAAHNRFLSWGSGECKEEPTPTECEVEISASDQTIDANFAPAEQLLTVSSNVGGSVSAATGALSGCSHNGGVCSAPYPEKSLVTLTASPAPHYRLQAWSGCREEPAPLRCAVEIGSGPTAASAEFVPITHTVAVLPAGPGLVSATSGAIGQCSATGGTCSGAYLEAATVVLSASPAPGQAVIWQGCGRTSGDTCELEVAAADAAVRATFVPITYTLAISRAGDGAGQVSCNGLPCTTAYPAGTSLTLTASPAAGSTFNGWSGVDCSGVAPCHLTLEADASITATFTANPPLPEKQKSPPLPKCREGFVRKHGHCVRKPKAKPHHHRHRGEGR